MADQRNTNGITKLPVNMDKKHADLEANGVLDNMAAKKSELTNKSNSGSETASTNHKNMEKPTQHDSLPPPYYKGLRFLRGSLTEIEQIGTMAVRDDDIWVYSFPRSGTTLTQELVYLTETLDFKKANSVHLDERFPWIDYLDEGRPFYGGLKAVEALASPRFIKCHLHYFLLPEQLRAGKAKIIYTARNLRDTLWSCYQFSNFMGVKRSFEEFFERFMASKEAYTPWGAHVREFWEHRNDANVLFLRFEDTVSDMPETVRKIAKYLHRQLSEEDVKKICEHCNIKNMKMNEMTSAGYLQQFGKLDTSGNYGGMINTGTGGSWRSCLTEEMDKRIEEEIEKHLGGGGGGRVLHLTLTDQHN